MLSTCSLLACLTLAGAGETVLLDFSSEYCGPCRMMEPTVQRLANEGVPIRRIDINRQPEIAAQYGVRSVPCFIMVSGGRVVDRVVGATTYDRLRRMLPANVAPAEVPSKGAADVRPAGGVAAGGPLIRNALQSNDRTAMPLVPVSMPAGPTAPVTPEPVGGATVPIATPDARQSLEERILQATVRLKIDDSTGHNYGSGTIIDVRGEEALVLTCGHVFRDSQGRGQIWIDLFVPGTAGPVPGQLVGYDLKRDVGLVSFRPGVKVTPMPVAPAEYAVRSDDRVLVGGCDRGGVPRVQRTHVTAVNKFLGPANVEVAGQPVDGRSGGGLFSADGLVVGVCNAADPADNEGLYAALSTVQAELDKAGLATLYQRRNPAGDSEPALAEHRDPPPPSIPTTREPALGLDGRGHVPANPIGEGLGMLSGQERELLDALEDSSGDAEVICIVRSRSKPEAASKVIVLQQPSRALLRELVQQFGDTDAARPTTLRISERASDRSEPSRNEYRPGSTTVRGQSW